MARGRFNFFKIDDSYTMDEEADDDPSSSIPPQGNVENDSSAAKLISAPDESSSSQLAVAEEKKSDNCTSNESAGEPQHDVDGRLHEKLVDAETMRMSAASILTTPQSSNLPDDQFIYQPLVSQRKRSEARRSSSTDDTNNGSAEQQPIQSTMAMVKLRVWDPAAPSKQFHVITSTTVMLGDQQNNNTSNNDGKSDTITPLSKFHERTQKRLSVVKEEGLNSQGSIFEEIDGDENKIAETNSSLENSNHDAVLLSDDRRIQFHQQERQMIVKSNNLSQLVEEDENACVIETNNRLQVGNLVGIHLITNNNTRSGASSSLLSINSTTARNNKQSEWKVGNSIRVLHNLNVIPSHTEGLEQLLYKIEHNDPSIRELILDGITTNSTPTPLSHKHLEILIEAIGHNTSIHKCSIQHSQITNQIASMLALALVDNTTISILSLRGNELTSVAVKNFYSVLSSNNRTLRVLDISDNPGIEEDVSEAFETFMEQRAVKRMLMLKAEKAKRIARGLPLLNEMLEEEEDGIIGSGGSGKKGRRNGSDGGGCGVTVVCHPDVIDGSFHDNGSNSERAQPQQFHGSSNTGNSYESVLQSEGPVSGSSPEQDRVYHDSIMSDITGIGGRDVDSPLPQQQQQDLHSPQTIGSNLYPQHQEQQQQQQQERMPFPQQSNRQFDPSYSMASSQLSSNDSSTLRSGNESLDNRQRQQLATVTSNLNLQHSTLTVSQHSTSSRSGNDKAAERELRRQLANQGQRIGAYAIHDEAPHRQEVRGRRTRPRRTESQRMARLSEITDTTPARQASAAAAAIDEEGGGIVDADIEGIEEYEYRNMSKYHKFFYRIGLDGEENKTDRMICLTFCVCILVLFATITLYVTLFD